MASTPPAGQPPAFPFPFPGLGQQTAPPPTPPLPAGAPVPNDPIGRVDLAFLRQKAQAVLQELIAALPPAERSRVQTIPLAIDDTVGEVNAFAACSNGKSLMAVSDGLLQIEASLSRAKATDELFGTQKTSEYIALVARSQRPKQPVVLPPPGFFHPAHETDFRRVTRQHQLLEEQLAFVLGHELGHHYLGHLPCTATGAAVAAEELNRVLSSAVPAFNQPNELASDVAGVNNLLAAGRRRSGYHWTEGGALLTMDFFAGLRSFTPEDLIFGFEHSHPPPELRRPVVVQTAEFARGGGFRLPGF